MFYLNLFTLVHAIFCQMIHEVLYLFLEFSVTYSYFLLYLLQLNRCITTIIIITIAGNSDNFSINSS